MRSKARAMPGKRITDHQVLKFKAQRRTRTQAAAAAKAGISERSARRLESLESLPSQRPARQGRTRMDPLAHVWEGEILPLLQRSPNLSAVTLLEELQRRYPGEYGDSTLRTLQRRLRQWRAMHGREREVFFAQEHPPGRQGLSDFTSTNDLGVVIAGEPFDHLLYQFALAHSGWRSADVVDGGESFTALLAPPDATVTAIRISSSDSRDNLPSHYSPTRTRPVRFRLQYPTEAQSIDFFE